MLMLILLSVILFLLVLLVVMQVTGWSVTSRQEPPEQFIREFRREMAGQRDETIRNLQAIKSEIESLFSDGIDEKIDPLVKRIEAAIALMQTIPSGVRKRSLRKSGDEGRLDDLLPEDSVAGESERISMARNALVNERQLMLFPEDGKNAYVATITTREFPESEEYISVPSADFDMDFDPPYDPDAREGSDALSNR